MFPQQDQYIIYLIIIMIYDNDLETVQVIQNI